MRVFLSFHSKDGSIAELVKTKLQSLEPALEIFFSPVSLGSGFWLPKLAEQIRDCDSFLLLCGPGGVGPWQVIEYFEAFDRSAKEPRFRLVPLIFGGAAAPGLPFMRQLNWVDVVDAADALAMSRVLDALQGAAGGIAAASAPSANALWKVVQPYRGLEAMTEANADYFYGRGAETSLLLDRLATRPDRLSMLIGASGVGKSSIARAGVLSALKAMRWPEASGARDGSGQRPWPVAFRDSRASWAFLVIRPGQAPLRALAAAFVRLWHPDNPTDPDRAALVGRWADSLRTGSNSLVDLLDATQEALEQRDSVKPERILIYLDQAEELYTRGLRGEGAEAARFAEQMAQTLADPRLLAFGSLRADYFDRLQADTPLFEHYEHVNVPPMRADQITEVVVAPATALGVTFEGDQLPERIVQAATSEPGQLPLLAYLLTDMWSAMVTHGDGCLRLPLGAIDIGGVLAARAEQFLQENPGEEIWVKRLFTLRLALVSPEGMTVRRSASRAECEPKEWALVEQLADYPWRLVVARERDQARGEPVAELAHEALLKAWPRLESWLREERDFLVFKAEVERAERRWHEKGKVEGALLGGLDLNSAESWQKLRSLDLTPDVRDFIAQSLAVDRLRKERALRFQRRVSAGFAVAAILLLGIGGWAIREWTHAAQLQSEATENARQAEAEKDRAERNASQAELERTHAEESARHAEAETKVADDERARAEESRRQAEAQTKVADVERAQAEENARQAEAERAVAEESKRQAESETKIAEDNAHRADAERVRSNRLLSNIGALFLNRTNTSQNIDSARRALEEDAAGGDPGAMYILGNFYANGIGVPHDAAQSRVWVERAANAGYVIAMLGMGVINEGLTPSDYEAAVGWYRKAAALGNDVAMDYLADLYYDGKGVPQDYGIAREWYEKAAVLGNDNAMNALGNIYRDGKGVPKDNKVAFEWYGKAAVAGNNFAMGHIGDIYADGAGVAQSYEMAREWYEKAVAAGNSAAGNSIGDLYYFGKGVPQSYGEALTWYQKSADADNADAMENIGWLWQNGWGVAQDYGKARDWYEKAASRGDAGAMDKLAELYKRGLGVAQDFGKAREQYERAADLGNSFAMTRLGDMYFDGQGVTSDYAAARSWYEKAAAVGNDDAMTRIGNMYLRANGVPQDYTTAKTWYEKAAAAGNSAAMNNIGDLFYFGQGVDKDYGKALTWYQKSADAGNVMAMDNIGWLYQNGWGEPKDYAKAREWYEKAAEGGSLDSMNKLASLYEKGLGVPQDFAKARGYYDKAADLGDSSALDRIGELYLDGLGTAADARTARGWFEKAAAAGSEIAMIHLGGLYADGNGVDKDLSKAREWYEKAAAAGSGEAMNRVGDLYYFGEGVPQNYAEAMVWYRKSADTGYADAMDNVGFLFQNGYGVQKDLAAAREWYEKGVAKGGIAATNHLGDLYYSGLGVPQSFDKARDYYQTAAEGGDRFAMNSLGWLYQHGWGVPQDYGKAREWFEKAAKAGNASAMNNLGFLYQDGLVGPRDFGKARDWYEKSAALGDAAAIDNLGSLYEHGDGVPVDYLKARQLYEKAAALGNIGAMLDAGGLYERGDGVVQDCGKARDFYQQAAKLGSTEAVSNLERIDRRCRSASRKRV